MKIERKVLSGILNIDDPNDAMPGTHHKDARNITFRGNAGQQRAESLPGNQMVTNSYFVSGNNTCIGSYYDELKQRVFYFVANTNGYDSIFIYNTVTKSITKLLQAITDGEATLFSFNPNFPIASVNILYRNDDDGDILHWTDRDNRPMCLNIKDATSLYPNTWKKSYLTVARQMPLLSAVCKYESDSSILINNLKNKVYQFRYRWVYKDFTKSTWSPWSKLFAPANVDALATEIDPLLNNKISVKYYTGDLDVVKIEIAARHSIDTTFTDPFLVATRDKAKLSLASNVPDSAYYFINNESYQYIDVTESNVLFDYVPLKANSQELLNGNIIIYGGITEGRTFSSPMTVSTVLDLASNADTSNRFTTSIYSTLVLSSSFPQTYVSGYRYFVFDGIPVIGDTVYFNAQIFNAGSFANISFTKVITSTEDTQAELETWLHNAFITNASMISFGLTSATLKLELTDPAFPGKRGVKIGGIVGQQKWVITIGAPLPTYVSGGLPPDDTGVNIACYKHKSRYSFGICYFDEYGVTNGVNTTTNMSIITPEVASTGLGDSQMTIPTIQFSISHQAPSWAKFFSFVRTKNLTASDFKSIITDSCWANAGNTYMYLDITSFQTNVKGYEVYSYNEGDRVRIIGQKNGSPSVKDYPILGLLLSAEIKESTTAPVDKIWIKVQYDSSYMSSFVTNKYYYIEPYTPTLNTTSDTQLYYEFGETYNVIQSGSNYYHDSLIQPQTASVPAIYKFYRGDVYNRQRETSLIALGSAPLWFLDRSMSDKYKSKIDGLGRPFVIDEYAKQTYFPALVRYSLEYQSGTNINNTNRFYPANFDEYDREKGDIQRLKVRGRQLRVFQNRACGVVPILQSLVQTADGSGVLSQSAEIINKIQYYLGEYGVGTQFCSIASSAQADYFTDPVRGCQVRLSADGITSISELYKAHYTLTPLINKYNNEKGNITGYGKAKILGFYDQFNEEFITCMQESTGSSPLKSEPKTFGFNEMKNSYTSFYEYYPEWAMSAENTVITWKDGQLWRHDNTTNYANFYGVQYKPSITLVFNQYESIKKRYNTITMLCNKAWLPNTNGDITTNLGQTSSLQLTDFIFRDDKFHASFKRDSLSTGGLYNGNVLKGNWAQIKLQPVNGNEFVNLYYIELSILEPFYNR